MPLTFAHMLNVNKPVHWPGTDRTPEMTLDPGSGSISLSGCSIPENADRFYSPLYDLVNSYCARAAKETTVHIRLTYFNSSSSKYLLDLLKCLEDLHAGGNSQVRMVWHHGKGDLDMQEAGEDYRSLVDFPVEVCEDH